MIDPQPIPVSLPTWAAIKPKSTPAPAFAPRAASRKIRNVSTPQKHIRIALALVMKKHSWLVAQRHPDVHLGNLWEFPGGKQHINETACDAALRELREECAIEATALRTLPVVRHDYIDRSVALTPVICAWLAGVPRTRNHLPWRWASVDELHQLPMPAANQAILRQLSAMRCDNPDIT